MLRAEKAHQAESCFRMVAISLLLFTLSGCAGPMGVTKVSPASSYQLSTSNPLGHGKMSDSVRSVLQRYDLFETFIDDPGKAIQVLDDITRIDDRRDLLFALAELSYFQGGKLQDGWSQESRRSGQDLFLQSAVYAYYYLLGDGGEPPPSAYDIRFREACDLYNRAL